MELVVMVLAFARQGFQVCREILDPQGQRALRVHQVRKDPTDLVETEVRWGNLEQKAPRAPRDLRGPRVQRAQEELKVTLAIREAKALQAPRDLQAHWEVTGNSACLKILTKARTVD